MVLILAVGLNTELLAYPTLADLLGISRYPSPSSVEVEDAQQNGAIADIPVPDTASGFGRFDAEVWLPPQYFTEPLTRFPVVILTHGNPGQSTDWLEGGDVAEVGLEAARAAQPVILVMPTVLRTPYGDSLCVNTALAGQRRDLRRRGRRGRRRCSCAPCPTRRTARRGALDGGVLRPQPRPQASRRVLGGAGLLAPHGVRAGRHRRR